jgi:hypothetical protein
MLPVQTNLVTFKVVEPLIEPTAASIVVCPAPTVLASPSLLIVATSRADELHVTLLVRSWVRPSLYIPLAVNCSIRSGKIEASAGVTAMERSTGPKPLPRWATTLRLPETRSKSKKTVPPKNNPVRYFAGLELKLGKQLEGR